jgi:UDP-N-acetylmuramyl pentapeptide synthase
MKSFFKKIITAILEIESRLVLKKYKPKIIAVTGSVGKTSTKDAIFTVLSPYMSVRKSDKSFNSEIGVPLTILGCQNAWTNPLRWLNNIIHGFDLILMKNEYPACLVLEVGADRPGDIKRITSWLRPDVSVLTRIGPMPVHVEFFSSRADLVREKSYLASSLKKGGTLILNHDDEDIRNFKHLAKNNRLITYGLHEPAEITASNEVIVYEEKNGVKMPTGFGFKINYNGNVVPVTLPGVLGFQHLYPVLAAVAVGISQDLNMVEITQALVNHVPPRGRMNLIPGVKDTVIIDDSYNSSPVALHEAFDAFRNIECSGRKIAVLGDMLELGKFSGEEHRVAGEHVAEIAKKLITVGMRARLVAESAEKAGMKARDIMSFNTAREAAGYIFGMIKKGDLFLVKGSQSMRMERVVEVLMAHPEDREKLLVRQEREWIVRE